MRLLPWVLSLAVVAATTLHGCGGFDPVEAQELKITDVRVTGLGASGVRVDWRTTNPANSRIDYGPAESPVTTFYLTDENGIGLDVDGHVMSEARTNGTTVGPEVNTVAEPHMRIDHSLVAARMSPTTTFYLAITAVDCHGQRAVHTVALPRSTLLITPP